MYYSLDTHSIYSQFVNNSRGTGGDSAGVIRILYANSLYLERDWGWGEGSAPLSACPNMTGRCEFTTNMFLVKDSDALLFHMRNDLDIPAYRQPHQKWIFAISESPVHTYLDLKHFENMFNLTMTYVHSADNDIDWSYGRCMRITNYNRRFQLEHTSGARLNGSGSPPYVKYAHGKKHLAAWFVTNCKANSHREMYVKEMQRYADIHVYGCGPYNCSILNATFCDEELLNNDYKFYLAFENSFCKDYVTEKLWRVMSINIVPVVMGLANYRQMLPPHSYIDVRDFASPKHLVDFLKRLDAKDTLYNEYFRWKTHYRCGAVDINIACDLCRYLHKTRGRQQRVKNLSSFWSRQNNCIQSRTFYKTLGGIAYARKRNRKRRLHARKKSVNKPKYSVHNIREEIGTVRNRLLTIT